MATAKEFVHRVDEVEGVEGCLLVRDDGHVVAQTIENAECYSSLLVISGGYARELRGKVGFSLCRFLTFHRGGKQDLHVFPIGRYFLGVIEKPDCVHREMLDTLTYLVSRVSSPGGDSKKKLTEPRGTHASRS